MDKKENASPVRQGRYYGDGGLYKHVKVPVKVVETVILVLIVLLVALILFGSITGGYTVNFDSMGGTRLEPQKLSYGDLITEPSPPTMEGHTFLGWYTDEACTQAWNFQTDAVTGSMTLYAGWIE